MKFVETDERIHVPVVPFGSGWAIQEGVQSETLEGRKAHHVQHRVERDVAEIRVDFSVGVKEVVLWARLTGEYRFSWLVPFFSRFWLGPQLR